MVGGCGAFARGTDAVCLVEVCDGEGGGEGGGGEGRGGYSGEGGRHDDGGGCGCR